MNGRTCDIAIVGGGLSGGLIALALTMHRPQATIRLIESGERPGGNHRWSWFATDLSLSGQALMRPFRKTEWTDGYDVRFPARERHLGADYLSLASDDFAATLERELAPGTILAGRNAQRVSANAVELEGGETVTARAVVDCRGFAPSPHLYGGWQVFMGRHLRTAEPHGVARPLIMDATVEQSAPAGNGAAYRFVYVLPLGAREVFVEDTYYADRPDLDRDLLSGRIESYCHRAGLHGEPVHFETGVLPVVTGGDFAAYQAQQRIPGVAVAGARGGFVHPLTSYTLPIAVDVALSIAENADLPDEQLAAKIEAKARDHWRATGFYRLLGRMLFNGARPQDRYRIFERFYGLPEGLIERFYAGKSTFRDRARVLTGKPPIPIHRGIGALLSSSPPLLTADTTDKDRP